MGRLSHRAGDARVRWVWSPWRGRATIRAMPNHIRVLLLLPFLLATGLAAQDKVFTRADTLRGSNTPERAWWDVTFYDLHVRVNPADSTLQGWNAIGYRITGKPREMQVDLQVPLEVDSIVQAGRKVRYRRDGNALLLTVAKGKVGTSGSVTVYYHGRPRVAKNPPWDGGLIWSQDPDGSPWISTACQGLGASVWWPTKDIQSDEPDSQRIALTVPDSLQAVANGRLRGVERGGRGMDHLRVVRHRARSTTTTWRRTSVGTRPTPTPSRGSAET